MRNHDQKSDTAPLAMLLIEKLMILKDVDLFRYSSDEILLDICNILQEQIYSPGDLIIKEGEMGDSMYIIVNGKVKVHKQEKMITEFCSREIFGEMAALSPEVRTASVSATETTLLLKIQSDELFEIMSTNFELAKAVIEILCQRMRMMASQR